MYDVIVIGSGPGGMTASIYSSCFRLSHLVIGVSNGGQMALAPDILNYPGFEEVTGKELTERMVAQVKDRGGEIMNDSVIKIDKMDGNFKIETQNGKTFDTKTIILATGTERRKLNIPGETEYTGKGVQYCAICERFDYENKAVAVIGGANSAAQSSVQLSHAASKVYLIYRGTELRCDPIWLAQIKNDSKIEVLYNTTPMEIIGNGEKITKLKLKTNTDEKEIEIERIFIEIGGVPGTALIIPLGVEMDPGGFIKVNEKLETNIPGVFACGDVVSHKYSIEQISSAVGSGARAATSAFSYLKQQNAPSLWGTSQIQRPATPQSQNSK
ncbi:MAG: NAD(P)/FAD-dependent oxidoreductase [Candidatus Levybacteria bacterium]|nr:NAD(P)/FAD-dependent oxidoreductase [Candidatus Levybacteria bacterium]